MPGQGEWEQQENGEAPFHPHCRRIGTSVMLWKSESLGSVFCQLLDGGSDDGLSSWQGMWGWRVAQNLWTWVSTYIMSNPLPLHPSYVTVSVPQFFICKIRDDNSVHWKIRWMKASPDAWTRYLMHSEYPHSVGYWGYIVNFFWFCRPLVSVSLPLLYVIIKKYIHEWVRLCSNKFYLRTLRFNEVFMCCYSSFDFSPTI